MKETQLGILDGAGVAVIFGSIICAMIAIETRQYRRVERARACLGRTVHIAGRDWTALRRNGYTNIILVAVDDGKTELETETETVERLSMEKP